MEPSSSTARVEELLAHADWVRALARNLSRDDADADDLAQETWLAALRGAAPRRPGRAWLGGVTRNLSRMRWRAAGRRARHEETAAAQVPPASPDDAVARMEMQRLLADAILRLDEPWRSTVVQRYLDGRTSAEIARREDVPAATVRGRLKTALERLRADLDARHAGRRDAWRVGLVPVLGISADEARLLGAGSGAASSALPLALGILAAAAAVVVFVAVRAGDTTRSERPAREAPAEPPAPEVTTEPPAPESPSTPVTTPPHETPRPPDASADEGRPTPARETPRPPDRVADTAGGMTPVPAGEAVIGTPWDRLRELLRGRARQVQADFAFEAPEHRVAMDAFWIDRFEVTNAQYLRFLEDTAEASYDTDEATLANLVEVAGHLTDLPRDRWARDDVAWRQLYESNRDALWAAMPGHVVRDDAGVVDETATRDAFRHASLPRGLTLAFYDRKPPETWPSMRPPADRLDHPVTSVSYDDAEAFAAWAGKHVPTEQEWEYAARGPEGFVYPWGDEWFPDLSRCNWGAKNATEQTGFQPVTMAVDTLPRGRSWCGAQHMLGNAGEWTSSWFEPYPGNDREHVSMGEYVKVIRGATYVDLERLVLRLAARNFIGMGVKAPPRPGNRFAYIGFRCAAYPEPGRDHLDPVLRRGARGRRVSADRVAADRWAAAVATRWASPEDEVAHHVYVQGAARAVVLIPLASVLRPDAGSPRIRSLADLRKATRESQDPLPVAVLHTSLPLRDVHVRHGPTPLEPASTRVGTCPAGTYVLGVWHGRPCLCTEALELVAFLTPDVPSARRLDVREIAPEDLESARLVLDAAHDRIRVDLNVPVGGARNTSATAVVLEDLVLRFADGALDGDSWRIRSRAE